MCRLMRFYAGGVRREEMTEMPMTEFFDLIQDSKQLADDERREIERSRRGK